MNRDQLYQIAEDAVREAELCAEDIPAIDLYVDQITNLVSERLKSGSERYYDRQLTKTMINNYSKDGLITPVKGKKYNKEQIIQILTVYTLKNTLSIGEIKRLLQGAYSTEGFDGESLIRLYDEYLEIKDENRQLSREILDTLMEMHQLEPSDERGFMLTVGALLSLSAFLRQIAQAMIDEKYPLPEPEEEKEEKSEKKEEKKKEKEKKKRKEEAAMESEQQAQPSEGEES